MDDANVKKPGASSSETSSDPLTLYSPVSWENLLNSKVSFWPWSDTLAVRSRRWSLSLFQIRDEIARYQARPNGFFKWLYKPSDYNLKCAVVAHHDLGEAFSQIQTAPPETRARLVAALQPKVAGWLTHLQKSWFKVVHQFLDLFGLSEKSAKARRLYLAQVESSAFLNLDKDINGKFKVASLSELQAAHQRLSEHHQHLKQEGYTLTNKDKTTSLMHGFAGNLAPYQEALTKNQAILEQLSALSEPPQPDAYIDEDMLAAARNGGVTLKETLAQYYQPIVYTPEVTMPPIEERNNEAKKDGGRFEDHWHTFWFNCGVLGLDKEVNLTSLSAAFHADSLRYHWDSNLDGLQMHDLLELPIASKSALMAELREQEIKEQKPFAVLLERKAETALKAIVAASTESEEVREELQILRQRKNELFQESKKAYDKACDFYKEKVLVSDPHHLSFPDKKLLQAYQIKGYQDGLRHRRTSLVRIDVGSIIKLTHNIIFLEQAKREREQAKHEKEQAKREREAETARANEADRYLAAVQAERRMLLALCAQNGIDVTKLLAGKKPSANSFSPVAITTNTATPTRPTINTSLAEEKVPLSPACSVSTQNTTVPAKIEPCRVFAMTNAGVTNNNLIPNPTASIASTPSTTA